VAAPTSPVVTASRWPATIPARWPQRVDLRPPHLRFPRVTGVPRGTGAGAAVQLARRAAARGGRPGRRSADQL